MSALSIAMEMALVAAGYVKNDKTPLHPIHQELLDYVNSKEYQELIIQEQNGIIQSKQLK